ncbi:MAG: RNA polymerase factor sigma-54 [Burkholderiales bacterium]|nr:RNA polymerase factor sigma-54 [Phycisphaerae bacterium]
MSLSQSFSMRMDQRQVLTPRMIQSMEILQLPLTALEERIDEELQQNPVLELRTRDREASKDQIDSGRVERTEGEKSLIIDADQGSARDFERLEKMADYFENEEFGTNGSYRQSYWDGQDRDGKLDAMANTASRGSTLGEHLLGQWAFIEAPPAIKKAGIVLIDYIDADGYLRTSFDRIQLEQREPTSTADLTEALKLIHKLEPAGVGARDLGECLLLQLDALEEDEELSEGHDFDMERALVREHLKDLEQNRYPLIAKRLECSIDEVKAAVRRLGRLQPHPGRQFGADEAPAITPDAEIIFDESTGQYDVKMARDISPGLHLKGLYLKMLKKGVDKKTREFLTNNIRNAKWLIESIEQRRSTIERVIRVVVDTQREFFDKGPEFLRPLPMIGVADQLGVHVATVSRAVSEKWIQSPRGVFPLRRFFSGGTQSASGEDMSWDAVKEKLRILVDNEDKDNPLNDDELVEKLKEQGIDIARRTVAKYRKVLNIQTARQRKAY